jgi:hypothetical protein
VAWVTALGLLGALSAAVLDRPSPPVAGVVRDAAGPVAGTTVRFKASAVATTTDAAGRFTLPRPAGPARVTASKDGYLVAGADVRDGPLTLTLAPVPPGDYERYAWVDPTPDPARPSNCGTCHGELHREWAGGGHARSVSNRRFRNLYDGGDWHGRPNVGWGLLREHPDGAGVCAACHAPTAEPDAAADYDLRRTTGVAAQGVHCDFCHKVEGLAEGTIGLTHGRYLLRLRRPERGQLFFGPLDDVDRSEDVASAFQRDSRFCAACHEGTVFGVPVYTTYSEWRDSPAGRRGQSCQSCHLTPTGRLTNLAPGHGGVERDPRTLANHSFFAGSQAEMLRRCLTLTSAATRTAAGVSVAATVRAEDVGHRVPTGFPDHHLTLSVEAEDAAGRPIASAAGPVLPAFAGPERAGRLYAKVLKSFDGSVPAPFWRADPDVNDTRLRPGQDDRGDWTFPAAAVRVRVRLTYRRFWPEVAAAKGWPDDRIVVEERTIIITP